MSSFFVNKYLAPSALKEEMGKDMFFLHDVAYKKKNGYE